MVRRGCVLLARARARRQRSVGAGHPDQRRQSHRHAGRRTGARLDVCGQPERRRHNPASAKWAPTRPTCRSSCCGALTACSSRSTGVAVRRASTSRRLPVSGTYTVAASGLSGSAGPYSLTLAQSPEPYVVPAGDEGGLMTNGSNHHGHILVGDLDQWHFTAGHRRRRHDHDRRDPSGAGPTPASCRRSGFAGPMARNSASIGVQSAAQLHLPTPAADRARTPSSSGARTFRRAASIS